MAFAVPTLWNRRFRDELSKASAKRTTVAVLVRLRVAILRETASVKSELRSIHREDCKVKDQVNEYEKHRQCGHSPTDRADPYATEHSAHYAKCRHKQAEGH